MMTLMLTLIALMTGLKLRILLTMSLVVRFYFANMDSGEVDGITDPNYLKKLDDFASWLESQDEVVTVATVADVIKTLNKNMNEGLEEFYSIPDNKSLNAQYFLMYEFSVP